MKEESRKEKRTTRRRRHYLFLFMDNGIVASVLFHFFLIKKYEP